MSRIEIKEDIFWNKYSSKESTIYFKGYFYSHSISDIVNSFLKYSINDFIKVLNSIDGHFAFVVINESYTIAAVDKIRSTPLFFSKIDDGFIINNDPGKIVNKINFNKDTNESAVLELSMSGYTIGNKTVYKNLHSLKAGEFAIFKSNSYETHQYFNYYSKVENQKIDYVEDLSKLTRKVFKKMLDSIEGRQIVVPLSAGHDSRLVASILKELGCKDVICYSYGLKGNFESETAKLIAKKLGFKFYSIPLKHSQENTFYCSDEYKKFLKFSETFSSVPFIQSLSTIKFLKDSNLIKKDAVFVNGMSGDFISGAHINYLDKKINDNLSLSKEIILNTIIKKHFSLWGRGASIEKNKSLIKNSLWKEIEKNCGPLVLENAHAHYENSEFIDRQSKYVIMGQRAYEFYGYEWRLPLWDNEYIDFWLKVPAQLKRDQSLYMNMLNKNNFGSVWGVDYPINIKSIVPKWIIPFRFIFKIPFGLFGQKGKLYWHEFETVFFYYWMDNTRMMSSLSYWRVIKSIGRKPQNHVSWQAKDYLKSHKIK